MTSDTANVRLDGPLVIRPDYEVTDLRKPELDNVARRLTPAQKIWNLGGVRRLTIVLFVVVIWQLYASLGGVSELLFPTFGATLRALVDAVFSQDLLLKIWNSTQVLLVGYAIGMALAGVLTVFAVSTRIGSDILTTAASMFNPLPAIALLPLSMLWFGLGMGSLVFVLVHSVLWAVALNTHAGFQSVSETLRMVGRNYGLTGVPYVLKILIPAAFPSILSGLKIGWAFAWRTLIAAELVFGANQGGGGLGWFIFENSQNLMTAYVFAGQLTVMLIGVLVENVVFQTIETRTLRRWGMQR